MNATGQSRVGAAWGLPLMRFTLTYDGDLPSSGNGSRKNAAKWEIRKHFHPQLVELWRISPPLKALTGTPEFPVEGALIMQAHHTYSGPIKVRPMMLRDGKEYAGPPGARINLCELVERGGRSFLPLVRERLSLNCRLKILFLRKEAAGRVYQGGDLDNRIKTLLDALSVPQHPENVFHDADVADPVLCVLEDDTLVTGIDVQTERLLSGRSNSEHETRLIIEVDVRVTDARIYNHSFLGD